MALVTDRSYPESGTCERLSGQILPSRPIVRFSRSPMLGQSPAPGDAPWPVERAARHNDLARPNPTRIRTRRPRAAGARPDPGPRALRPASHWMAPQGSAMPAWHRDSHGIKKRADRWHRGGSHPDHMTGSAPEIGRAAPRCICAAKQPWPPRPKFYNRSKTHRLRLTLRPALGKTRS